MVDVRSQLCKLVRSATRGQRRLVILIDDLERCELSRAVEISQTANLLLAEVDVVTILIGDLARLREFAMRHFDGVSSVARAEADSESYGRSYFDKIVQIEFSIPPLDSAASRLLTEVSVATPPNLRNGPEPR